MQRRVVIPVLVLACVAAGCATTHDAAVQHSLNALNAVNTPSTTQAPQRERRNPAWPCQTKTVDGQREDVDPTPSLRPLDPMPAPGHMPAGSFMDKIYRSGHLIAGVDQNTLGFGYRTDGDIQGFDIDLLKEVARAIFGDPRGRIVFRSVTSSERLPATMDGEVDIVASLFSITCGATCAPPTTCQRWQYVDFSTQYYNAHQDVLVRKDSRIKRVSDLNGRTVCATATSTSITNIRNVAPRAKIYPVALRTDCLVALEEGTVDAITADNTILAGFQTQDKDNTQLLHVRHLEDEHYGMAINRAHPEFVRFVNGVLEQLRRNGRWDQLQEDDVVNVLGIDAQAAPTPEYRA
jgi:polar amino acid transport system substrate-binding protein